MNISKFTSSVFSLLLICLLAGGLSFSTSAQTEDRNTPQNPVWEKAFILKGTMDKATTKDFVKKVRTMQGVLSLQYCKKENAYLIKINKADYLSGMSSERKNDFFRMQDSESVKLCDNVFADFRALEPASMPKLCGKSETEMKKACGLN